MNTWLPKWFIMIDVMILNTTGVSNDSVPSHEIQANVFWLIGSLLFTKLVFSLLFCLQLSDIPPEPELSSGMCS